MMLSAGEKGLQRRAVAGFALAVVLAGVLGLVSWRNAQKAAKDADWVTHTHEVITALEATTRHLADVESGARGFALSGEDSFLAPYETGRRALGDDLEALRSLTADNADQQLRLQMLGPQVRDQIEAAASVVAARRLGRALTLDLLEHGRQVAEAARQTIEAMTATEKQLLRERDQHTHDARKLTNIAMGLSSLLGMVFLTLAGFSVNRQIGIGAKAREQLDALNAELEQRVAQRTAAIAEQTEELSRQAEELARSQLEVVNLNAELERKVMERTAELQAANKELEAFTYSVSHDLRAPLRHISGFTKILTEDYGSSLPPEAQQHLQRVEQGARRMGQLVDELLNLTRVGRQTVTMQVTGLSSIVKELLMTLLPETEGRKVDWKIGELPFVECDPTLVRLVFQNLMTNALKYSRPRSPAVIEIGQCEKDGEAAIFVKDNGVGFSMKYADKLFGVFQRLHRAEDFEGTGVGLATVYRIIQKHGGRVWAEAELDRGATFYFTLGGFKQLAAKAGGAV
jgi:signal transduction histidine kinase